MKEKQKKLRKTNWSEDAITLIALVVTIVVLLILAGVSISMLTGESGIITQAQEAKDEMKIREEKDKVNLAVQAAMIDKNGLINLTEDNFSNELTKNIGERDEYYTLEIAGKKFVVTYMDTQNSYIVDVEGKTIDKGPWIQGEKDSKGNITITNGEQTLYIGDYVEYDSLTGAKILSYKSSQEKNGYGEQIFKLEDYEYGWRVLGVDAAGQLLLISEDFVPLTGGRNYSGRIYYCLGSEDEALAKIAYANGVQELNDICSIYGQGKYAESARSVNAEDINKITGYKPEIALYKNSNFDPAQYGNEVTYTLTEEGIKYKGTKYPTSLETSDYTTFYYYTGKEWKTLTKNESVTLKNTAYFYYPNTLTDDSTNEDGSEPGISKTSVAYKMLFTNNFAWNAYWLAEACIATWEGFSEFGMRYVFEDQVWSTLLYQSKNNFSCYEFRGVRPVVTLKSSTELIDSGKTKDDCAIYYLD